MVLNIQINKLIKIAILLFSVSFHINADNWREEMKSLIYSPRYFGPNAFPTTEMREGLLSSLWEATVRSEIHQSKGDNTKDVFLQLYIPIAKGKAAIQFSGIIWEHYKLTPERVKEIHAAGTESPIKYQGDFIINCYYQLLKNKDWADIIASINLKTASGNRLCDARFTDATSYWFDLNIGRTLYQATNDLFSIRLQGLIGFYCWTTNDLIHRQNDALCFGGGITVKYDHFAIDTNCIGLSGYENNGDQPLTISTKLNYTLHKNIFSLTYKKGFKDNLFQTYALSYTRCF